MEGRHSDPDTMRPQRRPRLSWRATRNTSNLPTPAGRSTCSQREDNVTTGPSSPRPLPTLPRWHSCPRHPEAILERGQSGPLKTKTCKRPSFSLRKGRVLPKGTVKSSNYIVSILIGLVSLYWPVMLLWGRPDFRDHIKECFLLRRLQLYSEWISGNYHTFEIRKKKKIPSWGGQGGEEAAPFSLSLLILRKYLSIQTKLRLQKPGG